MYFDAEKYPLLTRFYDASSKMIIIPGPIYNGSSSVREEVVSLLMEGAPRGSSEAINNWALEVGGVLWDCDIRSWDSSYDFYMNVDLLDDPKSCTAPNYGNSIFSDKYVYLRKVRSFI